MITRQNITSLSAYIPKVDLNLLMLFELVYIYKSVTKAADIMDVSSSAVSQGLSRLRNYFDDPLFTRSGIKLESTAFADTLHNSICENYEELLMKLHSLSPTTAQSQLSIICSPYLTLTVFRPLVAIIEKLSPKCNIFHFLDDNFEQTGDRALLSRKVDIIFDIQPHNIRTRYSQLLYNEEIVFIRSNVHPRISSFTPIEQLAREKFTSINSDKLIFESLQNDFDLLFGSGRDIRFRTGSLFTVMALVSASDTIGIVPRRLATLFSDIFQISVIDTDAIISPVPVYMICNKIALKNKLIVGAFERMAKNFA